MKTQSKVKYEEWLKPETIHKASLNWLSQLEFAKDEKLFLDDLIKSYTLQLIDSKHYAKSKVIIDKLRTLEKNTNKIIETVRIHERGLKILVDDIEQVPEEKAYIDEHEKLTLAVNYFLEKYMKIKKEVFKLIKGIIKEGKQKHLLPYGKSTA